MAIFVANSLKIICNVLISEIEFEGSPNSNRLELYDLLNSLNVHERILIAKYFCKLPWNIGSLKVLSILQDLRILTATEYVLSCDKPEEIQLILNDFLESRFELLANLLINSTFDSANSLRLIALLEECLENLFNDLIVKPELNDLSFLSFIKEYVPANIRIKIIHNMLSSVMGLQQSNIKVAFHSFSSWINEGVDSLTFPQNLYTNMLSELTEEALSFLLKCSINDNFREWKFYLIMLQTISRNNNEIAGPYIRKHLKLRLKQCAAIPCKRTIIHMLLTARAATATTMDITKNLNNYAEWYKTNIGEMKFSLKDNEFQNVLAMLDQCVNYEIEADYLEVHTLVNISPPVLCGNLVKIYKSKCKQRLQQIKKGNIQVDELNESIVLEDSN